MRALVAPLIVASSLLLAVPAEAEKVTGLDRFQLWNDCKPLYLVVETMHEDAADIGLMRESVEAAVRSRLRGARLYDPEVPTKPILLTKVSVVGTAVHITLELKKLVIDVASGRTNFATTGKYRVLGTHGRNSGNVLSKLSEMMDQFIDDYLRVNASACKR